MTYPKKLTRPAGPLPEDGVEEVTVRDHAEELHYLEAGYRAGEDPALASPVAGPVAAPVAAPFDHDGKDGPGGSLPKNVMKLKSIARKEKIDIGTATKSDEIQAIIIAARREKVAQA